MFQSPGTMTELYQVAILVLLCIWSKCAATDRDQQANWANDISPNQFHNRYRRQLGSCSWGQPAISGCFTAPGGSRYCGRLPYICDPKAGGTGRCCLPAGYVGGGGQKCQNNATKQGTCDVNKPCQTEGYVCYQGLCCQLSGMRCANGKAPVSGCIAGQCRPQTPALQCEQNAMCCEAPVVATCPSGETPAGQCISNWCPSDMTCSNGWCCKKTTPALQCPNNAASKGACDTTRPCPDQGYLCVKGVCCERTGLRCADGKKVPVGSCISNQCPPRTPALTCETANNFCCETDNTPAGFTCPNNGGTPVDRCISGWCPSPFQCVTEGWCCRNACPNNATAQGACSSTQPCANDAQGYVCVQDVCCQLSGLRCNDGVTVPVGSCLDLECPKLKDEPALTCEKPNNLCCT